MTTVTGPSADLWVGYQMSETSMPAEVDALSPSQQVQRHEVILIREDFVECSRSEEFIEMLIGQAVNSQLLVGAGEHQQGKLIAASAAALKGIAPRGELEGMLAAQLVACHNAAMECYRRANVFAASASPRPQFESGEQALAHVHDSA
jgi:hypothetical protein